VPAPDEAARGQLLRVIASAAIERQFGVRPAFQNCHRVAVFRPEATRAHADFITARSQILNQTGQRSRRQRNPRGQGERLRDDIIEAASRLLEDPTSPPLSLRGVARAVGVAATSVYLHFDDVDSLVRAVADRHFSEMVRRQDEASNGVTEPCALVRAGALSYCEFGLAHPGQYQVMFSNPLPLLPPGPGRRPGPGAGPAGLGSPGGGDRRVPRPPSRRRCVHPDRDAGLAATSRPCQPAHLPAAVPLAPTR
jgi:AcrR family transcriptional regulator